MQTKRLKLRFEGKAHNIDLSIGPNSRLELNNLEELRGHIQFCGAPIRKCVLQGKFLDESEMTNFAKLLEENHIAFRLDQLKDGEVTAVELTAQQNKPAPPRIAPPADSFFSRVFAKKPPTKPTEKTSLMRNTDSVPMQDLHIRTK